MDAAMLIVAIGTMVVAGIAAVAAIVQARSAHASQLAAEDARNESRVARDEAVKLSSEANEAFKRQAAAQERANELTEAKETPKPWSGQRRVNGDLRAIANSSGRTIIVESVTARPEGGRFFEFNDEYPHSYGPGDELRFAVSTVFQGSAESMLINWRFMDSEQLVGTIVNF